MATTKKRSKPPPDDSAENLLVFYLPLVLVTGLASSLVVLGLRPHALRRVHVATAILALGAANYLVVRPDVFHSRTTSVISPTASSPSPITKTSTKSASGSGLKAQ